MRLFSYQDKKGRHTVGVINDQNVSSFIDLCATDSWIPNRLLELIEADPQFLMVKDALANPQAVRGELSEITFTTLIDHPEKSSAWGLTMPIMPKRVAMLDPSTPVFLCEDLVP